MSPPRCFLGRHTYASYSARQFDNPDGPIEGVMQVCEKCGAQKPTWGLLRKGAKLFNQKGQWVATVEKSAIK